MTQVLVLKQQINGLAKRDNQYNITLKCLYPVIITGSLWHVFVVTVTKIFNAKFKTYFVLII